EMARDKILLSLQEAQQRKAEARIQLADAIGLPEEALERLQVSFQDFNRLPSMNKLQFEKIKQVALLNRSDILAALAEYAASESALQLEIAKQYPDIHLGPGYT